MNLPISQIEVDEQAHSLTVLVTRAARNLQSATSSAEVLEARRSASVAYDASKKAARMMQAKGAHDELIAAAHRAQADALEIEASAKRRLADEYDAAQERGEVATRQNNPGSMGHVDDANMPATAADLGLRRDEIHEARMIRDAEEAHPGIVRETLDRSLEERREPTKAEMRRSILAAVAEVKKRPKKPRNPHYKPDPLFDRIARVSSECESVAEILTGNRESILAFDEIPTTVSRLNRNVDAAFDALKQFKEARDA